VEMIGSSDAGSSWIAQPTVIEQVCANAADPNVSLAGPQAAVAPDGEVYVAWEAMGEHGGTLIAREIRVAKSSDSGATFSAPVVVAPVAITGNGADLQGSIRSSEFPSLAIGIGKTNNGFVYLSWSSAASPSRTRSLPSGHTASPTSCFPNPATAARAGQRQFESITIGRAAAYRSP